MKLGYQEKKMSNDFILAPDRKESVNTMMNALSRSFTFYKTKTDIQKDISLRHLRMTYISWLHQAMGIETRILSSHSNDNVLVEHYLVPTILTTIEKGALNIKIFGS